MPDEIWEFYAKEYQAAEARAWQPIRSGVPYTCEDCPRYVEMLEQLAKWKAVADRFYNSDPHDLAALQFAYMAYEEARDAVQP